MSEPKPPPSDAALARIEARLSRIAGVPSPSAVARRLARFGYDPTPENVEMVFSWLAGSPQSLAVEPASDDSPSQAASPPSAPPSDSAPAPASSAPKKRGRRRKVVSNG